jgi:thioredoxin 1
VEAKPEAFSCDAQNGARPAGFDNSRPGGYHGPRRGRRADPDHFDHSAIKEHAMSDDVIIHGTDDGFDQDVLKSAIPVLVDFWAPWCGPCLMIAPVLEEIAQVNKGKLKVVKINVDENGKTPMTYGVMAIPTLVLFKGGELKEKSVGVLPKSKLIELVARYL